MTESARKKSKEDDITKNMMEGVGQKAVREAMKRPLGLTGEEVGKRGRVRTDRD